MSDDASVDAIVAGVRGVMRELKMIAAGPAPVARPVYLDPAEVVTSPATGILYWLVKPNQMVKKGTVLARITDFFGQLPAEVESPLDGVVLYVVATPPISKGQPVACIGSPCERA